VVDDVERSEGRHQVDDVVQVGAAPFVPFGRRIMEPVVRRNDDETGFREQIQIYDCDVVLSFRSHLCRRGCR
jgi:hypothetical protein